MQELFLASGSPPSTPRPQYDGSAGSDSNRYGFHSPVPIETTSSPQQASKSVTSRSVLEMDRERRERREKSRKEKGTVLCWGNDGNTNSEEEGSIASPEGIPSAVPNLREVPENQPEPQDEAPIGRGPFSHKRRRLSLRTAGTSVGSDFTFHTSTIVAESNQQRTMSVPPPAVTAFFSMVPPAPKTFYSPPNFVECGGFHNCANSRSDSPFDYRSRSSSSDSMRAHRSSSMLMPSLTDDNSDTPAWPLLSATTAFAAPNHHKRKLNRNGHFNEHAPAPNVVRRTSPLHFFHSQQKTTVTGEGIATSPPMRHATSLDELVCHLRPRRSVSLEDEFSRQLSFQGMVGWH
jgi:hypothetical protein